MRRTGAFWRWIGRAADVVGLLGLLTLVHDPAVSAAVLAVLFLCAGLAIHILSRRGVIGDTNETHEQATRARVIALMHKIWIMNFLQKNVADLSDVDLVVEAQVADDLVKPDL